MGHLNLTNISLSLVLAILLYLPFSVYGFEKVEKSPSSQVLSATATVSKFLKFDKTDSNVVAYEKVIFKVFSNQNAKYENFYSVTNDTNEVLEYEVKVISEGFESNLYFNDNLLQRILVLPGQTAYLSANFDEDPYILNATLEFIVISR